MKELENHLKFSLLDFVELWHQELLERGMIVLIIARLLDHADTQSAHVYTENTPEHLTSIDKAMAMQLAPIAQAFAGKLVIHEKYAKRGSELSSRIKSRDSGDGVGTCGTHSFVPL